MRLTLILSADGYVELRQQQRRADLDPQLRRHVPGRPDQLHQGHARPG